MNKYVNISEDVRNISLPRDQISRRKRDDSTSGNQSFEPQKIRVVSLKCDSIQFHQLVGRGIEFSKKVLKMDTKIMSEGDSSVAEVVNKNSIQKWKPTKIHINN